MRYCCTVLSVSDINKARSFYENIFGLEVCQDYGRNILFSCGLALQQDFDWLIGVSKEQVYKKPTIVEGGGEEMKMVIERFISDGMTLEEVSKRMDVSVDDLLKLLNYGDTCSKR